jgi:hypothetical protein
MNSAFSMGALPGESQVVGGTWWGPAIVIPLEARIPSPES